MNHFHKKLSKERPKITKLDARIIERGRIISTIDMMPCSLQKTKTANHRSTRDLILENNYLRQEIVYYKQSRKAMIVFHDDTLKFFQLLQAALKRLFHKMAMFEEFMLRY